MGRKEGAHSEVPTTSLPQLNLTCLGVHPQKRRMHAFSFRQKNPLFDTKRMPTPHKPIAEEKKL